MPIYGQPSRRISSDGLLREAAAAWASKRVGPVFGDLPFEAGWEPFLRKLFPVAFSDPEGSPVAFGDHQRALWDWVWALKRGTRPQPFIAIWNRGAGKSTTAEAACVAVAVKQTRRYGLYVCGTQPLANDHLRNVAAMLELSEVEEFYPTVASRKLNKFSVSRGWTQNRLMTASGFTLDALGLDTAARGIKVESQRPDFIILDDVDSEMDAPVVIKGKISAITKKLLPAGSEDCAVLGVQNLIHVDSVFSRLLDGRADDRHGDRTGGDH